MTWSWVNIDWTATATVAAAWVQALLTVVAVVFTSRLQDRSVAMRDKAARNRRLKGAAAIARYAGTTVAKTLAPMTDGMPREAFFAAYRIGLNLEPAKRAIKAIEIDQLGDADLIEAVLDLEYWLQQVEVPLNLFGQNTAQAFNVLVALEGRPAKLAASVAKVETRVAEISRQAG